MKLGGRSSQSELRRKCGRSRGLSRMSPPVGLARLYAHSVSMCLLSTCFLSPIFRAWPQRRGWYPMPCAPARVESKPFRSDHGTGSACNSTMGITGKSRSHRGQGGWNAGSLPSRLVIFLLPRVGSRPSWTAAGETDYNEARSNIIQYLPNTGTWN
jgi:hypothetical protein